MVNGECLTLILLLLISPLIHPHPGPFICPPIAAQSLKNFQMEISGGNLAWLNPMHPEVRQFLIDLIVDVVKRYPVDGIQLDDHFSLPISMGYDPYSVKLYQESHGGALPPDDPSATGWIAWRAHSIWRGIFLLVGDNL